ncbi:DUF951 domain-containing protein [Paraclostridium ghonii]|uniref:DUF951 domain-containing protein n=1 Tax=Paraclostridium ghonii TaxID=29358 RepID=UPI00202CA9F9|nr:DUF951 domain-containing protein [Paeniclostridium ghonii]MCM0166847.1 DUF951 domain-containing protein [Paeniclostridium ghonii]
MPMKLNIGDIVELKKPHPCGSKEFEIARAGMDFKIRCIKCDRVLMLDRQTLEKRIKRVKEL